MNNTEHSLNNIDLEKYFPEDYGWKIVFVDDSKIDRRDTVEGQPIRCIDRRFGMTPEGYRADQVPLAPAWLGAIDGLHPFYSGSIEERVERSVKVTETLGFKSASHGDYTSGDNGCKFREALMKNKFKGIRNPTEEEFTAEELKFLKQKYGVEHRNLHDSNDTTQGFVLNPKPFTTVMPEGGRFYVIDGWFAEMAGIKYERSLSVIAACGDLLLPEDHKVLYIVQG